MLILVHSKIGCIKLRINYQQIQLIHQNYEGLFHFLNILHVSNTQMGLENKHTLFPEHLLYLHRSDLNF